MDKKKYLIGDIVFDIEFSRRFSKGGRSPFIIRDSNTAISIPHINIKLEIGPIIKDQSLKSINKEIAGAKTDTGYTVCLYDSGGMPAHLIKTSPDWTGIEVRSAMAQKLPFEGSAGEVIFRNSILFSSGIVVHAAAIDYKGKGIIFSGPSGTGKSTHARLWKKHKGALILNGDRPAMRIAGDSVDLYGTPWAGTSREFVNQKAPLEAIVMLEQGSSNEIRRLTNEEAVRLLAARCYSPYFDKDLMSLALDNIGGIIERVPVYLLECTPDHSAVESVVECLRL